VLDATVVWEAVQVGIDKEIADRAFNKVVIVKFIILAHLALSHSQHSSQVLHFKQKTTPKNFSWHPGHWMKELAFFFSSLRFNQKHP
jgi:hypothetical protein